MQNLLSNKERFDIYLNFFFFCFNPNECQAGQRRLLSDNLPAMFVKSGSSVKSGFVKKI